MEIFQIHVKNMPVNNMDYDDLAEKTEDFSGSDIEQVVRLAARRAITENRSFISDRDLFSCIETIKYKKIKQEITIKERNGFTLKTLKSEELIRKAVELREEGLSLEEIGERIGKSPTTVHRYIHQK
jgi:SpoVK/Ycf46/Vps4 family AAA+-type ATPase